MLSGKNVLLAITGSIAAYKSAYLVRDFIKRGAKHRIRNIGSNTAVMIEVQFGDKIDENDIKRYDDKYGRA